MPDTQLKKEIDAEAFASFLEWLTPDREAAGAAYESLRFRLCTFFSRRQCSFPDELADETINRIILKSRQQDIENKMAYCYGVARNVYLESTRRERHYVNIDDLNLPEREPEQPSFSHDCLDKCLANLSPETRTLLLTYFSEAKTRKIQLRRRISESVQTTQTALRMRVCRTKNQLRRCVLQCMNS